MTLDTNVPGSRCLLKEREGAVPGQPRCLWWHGIHAGIHRVEALAAGHHLQRVVHPGGQAMPMTAYELLKRNANIARVHLVHSAISLHPTGPALHDDLWWTETTPSDTVRACTTSRHNTSSIYSPQMFSRSKQIRMRRGMDWCTSGSSSRGDCGCVVPTPAGLRHTGAFVQSGASVGSNTHGISPLSNTTAHDLRHPSLGLASPASHCRCPKPCRVRTRVT